MTKTPMTKSNRGGSRPGAGRTPLPPGQKRQTYSIVLPPEIKALAEVIAEKQGLPGWGWAVEGLIRKMAKEMLNE